jgi:D-alanyl-D-alanine carboxypeptidase
MKPGWLIGVAAAVLVGASASAQPQPVAPVAEVKDRAAALHAIGEEWIGKCGVPGITIAAIGADGELVKAAAGLSRVATQTPMRPDDRMFTGSIGKTYFAAVILQLAAEGKVKLDEPISGVVKDEAWFECLPNATSLTLRMLLNHTTGIPEHVETPEFVAALRAEPMKRWDFGDLLKHFACGKEALFEAGKGWSYADTNYIVAGLVVEKATGRAMYDLVRERIVTPLKLADTLPSDRPEIPGLVCGYEGGRHLFTDSEEFVVVGKCVLNR